MEQENYISMKCNYAYRERCRQIPGAEFNKALKVWQVPILSLPYIECEFYGELYFKTPLWKLKGEPKPEKAPLEFFHEPVKIPKLALEPFDYQKEGIQFMIDRLRKAKPSDFDENGNPIKTPVLHGLGFVLQADGVGLGKTYQSLGALKWFVENDGARKILIVCKKSIKYQWESEIRKITGWKKVPIYVTGSTKKKRHKAYEGMKNAEAGILITNYHNFLNDYDEINSVDYDFCILDEAHCVKAGKMNERIGSVMRGKKTILLTGTPLMSKPEDIYGIISIADPDFYGSAEEFNERFLIKEFTKYGEQTIGAKNLDILQESIKAFHISRTPDEAFEETGQKKPPKTLPPTRIMCEMDIIQEKMYAAIQKQKDKIDQEKEEILRRKGLSEEGKQEIIELNEKGKMFIASLQLISDDPACFRYLSPEHGINKYIAGMVPDDYDMSAKTEATLERVQNIVDNDEKAIIFCHYYSAAALISDRIMGDLGIEPVMFTGRENDDEREHNKKLFCENDAVQLMVATEAAAEGLNLQVARYTIHYEQAECFAQKEQRIGRVARIGSKYNTVITYDMVTEGSFDEVRLAKIQKDADLADLLLS